MTRVKTVREYVTRKLMEGDMETALKAVDHLNGAAMAAAYLAKRRGEDAELARTMLDEIGVTDEKETEQICSAIYHHDDKLVIDSPFDEVLKDADVMHHTFHDPAKPVKDKEKARYEKLLKGE